MSQQADRYRSSDPERAPVTQFLCVEDILEAMLQQLQGGELHQRLALEARPVSAFFGFVEIGVALRACLLDTGRRAELIERLWPCSDAIIGTLPAGIQPQGLLPDVSEADQRALGFRALPQISDDEIRAWVMQDGSMIYGELKRYELDNYFDAVAPLLRRDGAMFDLGSGLGKVVMSAALSLPFKRCVGVELLGYRHRMAQQRLDQLLTLRDQALQAVPAPATALRLPNGRHAPASHLLNLEQRIELIEQDMFETDLSDASLVFIYSTCFGPLMPALAARLARALPEHALVSTTTYALRHPGFRLVAEFPPNTLAWTVIYLYERVGALQDLGPGEPAYRFQPDRQAWEARVHEAFAQFDRNNN
jgi:hypothetical protein